MAQPTKTFVADSLRVRVYATQDQMVQDAAREAQTFLRETLLAHGRATAILATGNSQLRFLECLVKLGGTDWSKITLFHMDEYLGIAADHPASFRYYMRERVARLVQPKVFHYLEGDALLPIKECERYAQLLRAQPIDLCCLGIGENGHLAFNDPPVADFSDNRSVKIVKLDDACKRQQVGEGCCSSTPIPPACSDSARGSPRLIQVFGERSADMSACFNNFAKIPRGQSCARSS